MEMKTDSADGYQFLMPVYQFGSIDIHRIYSSLLIGMTADGTGANEKNRSAGTVSWFQGNHHYPVTQHNF